MIGGCERGFRSPDERSESGMQRHTVPDIASLIRATTLNLPRGWPSNVPLAAGAGAIDGGTGAGLASGFDSWHLFFCQASSASFDWPRNAM